MLIDTSAGKSEKKAALPAPWGIRVIAMLATYLLVAAGLFAAAGLVIKVCKWALAQW